MWFIALFFHLIIQNFFSCAFVTWKKHTQKHTKKPIWNRADCQHSEKRSERNKRLNRTLLSGQNKTGCKFSRESSFSSHKHCKNRHLLLVGFFKLPRMYVSHSMSPRWPNWSRDWTELWNKHFLHSTLEKQIFHIYFQAWKKAYSILCKDCFSYLVQWTFVSTHGQHACQGKPRKRRRTRSTNTYLHLHNKITIILRDMNFCLGCRESNFVQTQNRSVQLSSLTDWVTGGTWGMIQQRSSSSLFCKRPLIQAVLAWAAKYSLWCFLSSISSTDHGVTPPKVPWWVLERLLWHVTVVTCPDHASFHLLTVARGGCCGSTQKLILLHTPVCLALQVGNAETFPQAWILLSESASKGPCSTAIE